MDRARSPTHYGDDDVSEEAEYYLVIAIWVVVFVVCGAIARRFEP